MSEIAERSGVIFQTELPGVPLLLRGKVRDVYDLGEKGLLVVATDRISAYDHVLPTPIPLKGRVLTQLSAFWFRRLSQLCPNHFLATDRVSLEAAVGAALPDYVVDGRSMLVRRTEVVAVECIVRGYLDGSAWREYRSSGSVCGQRLPPGLQQGSRLKPAIFTPATKSSSGHDLNISVAEMTSQLGSLLTRELQELSLALYEPATVFAAKRGLLIADTKFEFGVLNGEPVLIDECFTPDSSRFWEASAWKPGGAQASFDKQFVRDYLDQIGWDHEPPAPPLPPEVADQTSSRYTTLYTRLTDEKLS